MVRGGILKHLSSQFTLRANSKLSDIQLHLIPFLIYSK
jgi:hypothetical protein